MSRRGGIGGGEGLALRRAQLRLERWRERHGGRGVRIPERLWALAVAAARAEGIAATAAALRLDRQGLLRRVELEPESKHRGESAEVATFVELRMSELQGQGEVRAVVELSGRDGELMRLVVSDVRGLDVVSLARTFWSRQR
ncbi:MAG TPA: hypothetical protein VHR45_11050 [Thermoanaerobaculia bacterium]|nr:hypothetical protein [Thermoanaerobaculia bacterium]